MYRIKLPKTEKALPIIVEGVLKKNMQIKEISFTKPTLDQVFLEVTGKSMRDEDVVRERLDGPELHDGESEMITETLVLSARALKKWIRNPAAVVPGSSPRSST